ncbi:MAG: SAM-dependent methyltransferase [Candidatus Bathyarchaeia archaeon]
MYGFGAVLSELQGVRGKSVSLNFRESSSVAPYVPTPLNIVRRMLELVEANSNDILYDLGCGDGRILFSAVEEFNVRKAVGYELNPMMCEAVRRKADEKGLKGRIEVINGNFFLADLSPASVVTLYLTTSGNTKLKPKLEKELQKGSRVVSHDFPINGWKPVKSNTKDGFDVSSHRIYLYHIPESYQEGFEVCHTPEDGSGWRRIRNLFLRLERPGT